MLIEHLLLNIVVTFYIPGQLKKPISMCYTWNYYYTIIVYTAMVGMAATGLIYEKRFHNYNDYLYQLVTYLIGSVVCSESYII